MKLVILTVFALISTGLAFRLPADNLESAVNNLLSIDNDVFMTLVEETPDKECQEIADELKESTSKLLKIQEGLRKKNHNKIADALERTIELSKKFSQVENVTEDKKTAKKVLLIVRFLIRMGKKYLEEENSIASINSEEDVDEESKKIANEYREIYPKLEKIRAGFLKDDKKDALYDLSYYMYSYRKYFDPQEVANDKYAAKVRLAFFKVIVENNKHYLDEEDSDVLSLIQSEDNEVDDESKEIAKFIEDSLPKLEKIRDGLKKDNKNKQADYLEKVIVVYRPFSDPQKVAQQKMLAKSYKLFIAVTLKMYEEYLEE